MLTLSLAKCLKATNEGTFTAKNLNSTEPLSLDDMAFLTEYLRVTPLKVLDISIEISEENSYGLNELAQVIAKNSNITKLDFEVDELLFQSASNSNMQNKELSIREKYRLKKIHARVIDAVIEMISNKPNLHQLTINLEHVTTRATKAQAQQLAKNISKSPLSSLDIDLAIEQGAKLPLLSTTHPNTTLTHLILTHSTYGADLLNHLQNTRALKSLILNDLQLTLNDLSALARVLKSNPSLHLLILSNTNLGQIDPTLIFEQLQKSPNITNLELSESNLSCFNTDALCDYLSSEFCGLIELDLTKNAYMGNDIIKIATALAGNTKLEKITFDSNYIEDEGLQALINLVKTNRNITSISMSTNCRIHPSDATINELCSSLSDPLCQLKELNFEQKTNMEQLKKLNDAVMKNKSLETINLNYNLPDPLGLLYKVQIEQHFKDSSPDLIKAPNDDLSVMLEIPTDSKQESLGTKVNVTNSFFPTIVKEKRRDNDSQTSSLSN